MYIVSLFIPFIAHPVALLHGDRGSAKSTFGKVVKKLVDPAKPDIFSFPSSKDDLVRTLNKSYYTVFDNLSHITADSSDTLCRAVTGEGYTKRTLFTDDDDTVFEFRRAICLNGINLVSERPDLLDRSIIIELQRIPESRRMPESEFWRKFDEKLPHILGSIFDTVSKTLAIYPTIHPKKLFRMADFTKAGMAIAKAFGYTEEDFMRVYSENIKKQNTSVIDNDIVANTIVRLMEFQDMWKGSPTDLHSQLSALA